VVDLCHLFLPRLCPGVTETGFQEEADVQVSGAQPDDVAGFALRALDAKKRVAIHGLKNSLFAFSNRFSPRTLSARVARKVMEPWIKHRSS